jgi:hypothetical protein
MKPTLVLLGLASSFTAFFALREPAIDGRWATADDSKQFTIATSDGRAAGTGSWKVDLESGSEVCPVAIDISYGSTDERRYIGTLRASGACAGQRANLDCSLSEDRSRLDCGEGFVFTRN